MMFRNNRRLVINKLFNKIAMLPKTNKNMPTRVKPCVLKNDTEDKHLYGNACMHVYVCIFAECHCVCHVICFRKMALPQLNVS